MKTTIAAIFVLLMTSSLFAQDRTAELQAKFKQRYPQLQQLKQAGTIGETSDGYVDFVKGTDAGAADIVKQENDDRKELYQLLADKEKTTADKVAQANAKRNFTRAKSGEYLKQDGKWSRKA